MSGKSQLSQFAKGNWIVVAILTAALAAVAWFSFQVIRDVLYFNDPANQDVDLKPWMTPRYIVLTYDLPRPLVFEILELSEEEDGGIRLGRVANERGVSMEELTETVREAAEEYREDEQ